MIEWKRQSHVANYYARVIYIDSGGVTMKIFSELQKLRECDDDAMLVDHLQVSKKLQLTLTSRPKRKWFAESFAPFLWLVHFSPPKPQSIFVTKLITDPAISFKTTSPIVWHQAQREKRVWFTHFLCRPLSKMRKKHLDETNLHLPLSLTFVCSRSMKFVLIILILMMMKRADN